MSNVAFEKKMRHAAVMARSDYDHLKQCLLDAANRFSDIADQLEKDHKAEVLHFLRASAERYRAEAEGH
jgi:hypothetical protein